MELNRTLNYFFADNDQLQIISFFQKLCQEWDSNPRPQCGLRPERSALDRSAILTYWAHYKLLVKTIIAYLIILIYFNSGFY